jgi:microsomal dipeptidase-like Zn-dependent dipeptidase/GMP synthase-like glutamine amidotransferase
MKQFDLQAHVDCVYAQFPAAGRRPVIGITGNYADLCCTLGKGYYQSVIAAGGTPLVIPPSSDREVLMNTLDRIDGLILSGGADINPLWVGEDPVSGLHGINSERDLPELLITRLAYNRQLPMLGICRGIQTLAAALGGKVCQDIKTDIKHSQDADRSEPTHSVTIAQDSTLYNIYGNGDDEFLTPDSSLLYVNSFHHQAVEDAGTRFRVVATAADGIIEAIESTEYKSILCVQWHPECMGDSGQPLFKWLVGEARSYREAHDVHDRVLTLDTHCDTPMFFPQGIHFEQRDPRILVDLHKMTEGRQDATIMVAYLPQNSEDWKGVSGEKRAFADNIFDVIEQIVAANADYLALARTPQQLWDNKRAGRKSIMIGIENGLALEGDLQNVKHFAERGVVYITLCHNGDNDICDSARGNNTHGGVSAFGEQVIREMNRLGLMVDLSHAGEKSFYDALNISSTPIVCSHSSCRALCDHPRNLTDEQMRRLAQAGGVMQVTLYNGFLVREGEATILDAFAHLEHAISIMGIDHVGLGTDFDGDGGICGLRDSSELLQFTRQLLSRRYSEADIQKIWGGNFLRVMQQVQAAK